MAGEEAKAIAQISKRIIDERGAEITRLRAELAAEKALADYLAEGVKDLYEHSKYLDRYHKARGL